MFLLRRDADPATVPPQKLAGIVQMLLILSGVEENPGPKAPKTPCGVCAKNAPKLTYNALDAAFGRTSHARVSIRTTYRVAGYVETATRGGNRNISASCSLIATGLNTS